MKALNSVMGLVVVLLAAALASAQDTTATIPSILKTVFGKLPIYFIENRGVCPDEVACYSRKKL